MVHADKTDGGTRTVIVGVDPKNELSVVILQITDTYIEVIRPFRKLKVQRNLLMGVIAEPEGLITYRLRFLGIGTLLAEIKLPSFLAPEVADWLNANVVGKGPATTAGYGESSAASRIQAEEPQTAEPSGDSGSKSTPASTESGSGMGCLVTFLIVLALGFVGALTSQ